jgi:hypothetical protein
MKKSLLAAVVLVFASSTTSIAALKFPRDIIGDWCTDPLGGAVTITSDGTLEEGDAACELINSTMKSGEGIKGWTFRMRCDPGIDYPTGRPPPKEAKRHSVSERFYSFKIAGSEFLLREENKRLTLFRRCP